MLVQAQGVIGIFRRIRCGLFERDLVKRELVFAFARNVCKLNRAVLQVFFAQCVEIVATGGGIQHIRFEHGVVSNAAQFNAVIQQHAAVVFQVLPDFAQGLVF